MPSDFLDYSQLWEFCAVVSTAFSLAVVYYLWWTRGAMRVRNLPQAPPGALEGHGVCSCENACKIHLRRPESMVVGNMLLKVPVSKIPSCQVALYACDKGGKATQYRGSAIRVQNWLVAPYHVVVQDERIGALVYKDSRNATMIPIDSKKFIQLEGDLAAASLTEAQFSTLSLGKVSTIPFESETMATVCSSTKEPEMSFGLINHDRSVFGGVVFDGSTRSGFSGSAYMIGNRLAGMHVGGGVMNYGLSSTYILAMLERAESTAEFLEKIRRKGQTIVYQRNKFNPDEAIVFVNGRYYNVDLEDLTEFDEVGAFMTPTPTTQARFPEVQVAASFPPAHIDIAREVATAIDVVKDTQSKNGYLAGELPAEEANQLYQHHRKMMDYLDEKFMLLDGLQKNLATRYQESQRLVTGFQREDPGRKILVDEIEQLKMELAEVRAFKSSANAEASSLKAVPKAAKKKRLQESRSALLTSLTEKGINMEDLIQALIEDGKVVRTGQPAPSVEVMPVQAAEEPGGSGMLR